jgi:hypothetical protein
VAKVYSCNAVNFSWDNLYDSGKNIMNERIQKLAEQAGFLNKDEESIGYFAELIVRECEVALKPPVQVRDVISRGQAYDLIKKHFGVEE